MILHWKTIISKIKSWQQLFLWVAGSGNTFSIPFAILVCLAWAILTFLKGWTIFTLAWSGIAFGVDSTLSIFCAFGIWSRSLCTSFDLVNFRLQIDNGCRLKLWGDCVCYDVKVWVFSRLRGTGKNCGTVSPYRPVSCGFYKGFSVSFEVSPPKTVRILAA